MDLKQVSHGLPNLSLVRELLVLRLAKEALQTRAFLFWTLLSPSLAVSMRSFWRQEACEACIFHILAACSLFSMTRNQPNNEEWDEESLGNDGADYTSDAAVVDSDDNLHTPLISRQTRSVGVLSNMGSSSTSASLLISGITTLLMFTCIAVAMKLMDISGRRPREAFRGQVACGWAVLPRKQRVLKKGTPHCVNSAGLVAASELDLDGGIISVRSLSDGNPSFSPIYRSGSCSEMGPKSYMEDEHICIDDLPNHLGSPVHFPSLGAFYGVFDGHGGIDAALFIRENILKFIVEDSQFPVCMKKASESAFLKADYAFADDGSLDSSSGTTVLTALIFGR
ncbi:hypothetical protein F0562_028394 [Nyssa sinensis]|uniref:protein-serine/threonine phosphatase n=1 Tax=Nyssa sinensis TaxID=561372 RepID=A0A5J5B142_9ASTE|nr:hypothetical protein F0562_028394 [Nyssa sinensis]